MSGTDDGDRPVTAAELAAVTGALDEIRAGMEELRAASTPQERRDAKADVADAEQDLDALAKRLGIPRGKLDESIRAAKQAERKEELRPIIAEILAEAEAAKADPPPDDTGDDPPKDDPPKADPPKETDPPKADDPPKDPPKADPPKDTEPVKPHWSERAVGDLVR